MPIGYTHARVLLFSAIGFAACAAQAQGELMIYPKQGQSPDQQSRDRYECHTWAVQQSGYDPSNPQAAATGNNRSGMAKETLRGGARGAAAGAAIGAIAGDAGKGAAIGATAGGLSRRFKEKDRQNDQSSAGTTNPGQQSYQRAMAACLDGRGYSVK
jgi:hypothetical protein